MGFRAANGVILITTKKGKGKLSVELNSSYSIDEVNVRFKTQDVLDKDLMVISLETPVHPLRYHQQQKRSCRYCTAGSYFVSDRGNTYYGITKKIAQIILVLLITMGSLVLDTQATRTFH
jgi:hypothetical protein